MAARRQRSPFYMRVGARLRERREQLEYTLDEMGHFLGITGVGYGQYERGESEIPLDNLALVAKRLRRPIEWFIGEEQESGTGDEDELLAFYRGAPPAIKPIAKQVLRAIVQDAEREETTEGRKAE